MSKRRSESEWRALIEEQERSGQTASQFCEERGLCAKYFSTRRWQLKRKKSPPSAFIQAEIKPRKASDKSIELQFGQVVLKLPHGTPSTWLVSLISQLQP